MDTAYIHTYLEVMKHIYQSTIPCLQNETRSITRSILIYKES